MIIAERIRSLCKEQGISIRKLEIQLGLGSSSINKWRKSSPSLSALQKIADHFHVSLDYLAGKSDRQYEKKIYAPIFYKV